MRQVFHDVQKEDGELIDTSGNLAPAYSIFPDYVAPVNRRSEGWNCTLTTTRCGIQTPSVYLTGKRTATGVTNIRNLSSSH